MSVHYRWTLRVSFDLLGVQEQSDQDLAFPHDEVSRFVAHLRESWGIPLEDLDDFLLWEPTKVTVYADTLDNLEPAVSWLTVHTIPKYILVKRNEDR